MAATDNHSRYGSPSSHINGKGVVLGWQSNLQRSRNATNNLVADLAALHTLHSTQNDQNKEAICFITEPCTNKDKIAGVPGALQTFVNVLPGVRPRACVVATPGIDLWLVPEYSDGDVATVLYRPAGRDETEVYMTAVYMDITRNSVPDKLVSLVKFCERKQRRLVICSDTNAHSSLWNSPENNPRGDMVEDLIMQYCLDVKNVGSVPTFIGSMGHSIIDVTMTTANAASMVLDWHVNTSFQFSDHRRIEFGLTISTSRIQPKRNWIKGDYVLFQNDLMLCDKWDEKDWSRALVEERYRDLMYDINVAVDKHVPMTTGRPRRFTPSWWTKECNFWRKETRRAQKRSKITNLEVDLLHYHEVRTKYQELYVGAREDAWHEYCSTIKNPKEMAKLQKQVQGKENQALGLLKRVDGTFSASPLETMEILLDNHFPGSEEVTRGEHPLHDMDAVSWEEVDRHRLFTVEGIKHALSSFGELKAAGPDDLPPIVLQNLPYEFILKLRELYTACLLLGYSPKEWRTSKAIFIPKTGKSDYAQVKSFRPISLTSFLFKGMEKVVHRHLEATVMKSNPLSRNQHAFRRGHSTESALTDTIDEIESSLLRQRYTLATFLDVSAAFDNLSNAAAERAMERKKFPPDIIKWFSQYLRNRYVFTTLKDITLKRRVMQGTPQGGILSPLIWNIAFDEMLDLFDTGPVHAKGFADDGALLIHGIDPTIMMNFMQTAVDKVIEWGRKCGLTFNPTKTVCILFSRKYKKVLPADLLRMGEQVIPLSDSTRYLGVIVDKKLSWHEHVETKLKAAKSKLVRLRSVVGALWGPRPELLKWAYTGIVRPGFAYANIVWSHVISGSVVLKQKVQRLNRLAALFLAPIRQNTPVAALEVLYDILPMDLYLKGERMKGYLRTKPLHRHRWNGVGEGNKFRGHRLTIEHEMEYNPELSIANDRIPLEFYWDKKFRVNLASFEKGVPNSSDEWQIYTDGSGKDDMTGAGFVIYQNKKKIVWKAYHLQPHNTVFQAEMFGIYKATQELSMLPNRPKVITIYSDSQASLMALNSVTVTSNLQKDTMVSLDYLASTGTPVIELRYVKAHNGYEGNETADTVANWGADNLNGATAINTLPAPPSFFQTTVNTMVRKEWEARWKDQINQGKFAETGKIRPWLDRNFSKQLLGKERPLLGKLVPSGETCAVHHWPLLDDET